MGKSTFKLHSMPRVGWGWCVLTFLMTRKIKQYSSRHLGQGFGAEDINVPYVSARSQSEQCVGCREPHKFNNVGWRWTRLNKRAVTCDTFLRLALGLAPMLYISLGPRQGDLGKYVSRSNLPIKPLSVVNHNLRLTISYCMMHVSLAFWLTMEPLFSMHSFKQEDLGWDSKLQPSNALTNQPWVRFPKASLANYDR